MKDTENKVTILDLEIDIEENAQNENLALIRIAKELWRPDSPAPHQAARGVPVIPKSSRSSGSECLARSDHLTMLFLLAFFYAFPSLQVH